MSYTFILYKISRRFIDFTKYAYLIIKNEIHALPIKHQKKVKEFE